LSHDHFIHLVADLGDQLRVVGLQLILMFVRDPRKLVYTHLLVVNQEPLLLNHLFVFGLLSFLVLDRGLELSYGRLQLVDVLLRHKREFDLLQVLLADLELVEQVLHFLPFFLQLLARLDAFRLRLR